jgi:hypothetical protein
MPIANTISSSLTTVSLCAAVFAVVGAGAGCDPAVAAVEHINLRALIGEQAATGVSVDPATGNLHVLVPERGVFELDQRGTLVSERAVGSAGLEARAFKDVAALGDDRFVLLADNEGYLYDAQSERFDVHFCVVPGFTEGFIVQENDAVVQAGNALLAAPRFTTYDENGAVENVTAELRTYNAQTGEPTSVVPLSEVISLRGLAVDGDVVLGVSGSQLVQLGHDGNVQGKLSLVDVEDAAGLAVDGDTAWVLDAADAELRAFAVDALR